MRNIICALVLLFSSCAIDGPDCSNATFSLTAWQNESGMIRISYESELPGYELWVGCPVEVNHLPETWTLLASENYITWAEWSIQRSCSPEYIKVRSLDGQIEKIIKL